MRSLTPLRSAGVLTRPEVDGRQDRDLHLVAGQLEHLLAHRAAEHLLLVLRVADHVAGGEDRELGHQLGDVEGRDRAELQIPARHRRRFGALLEQRRVQVDLDVELAGRALVERLLEDGPHLAVPVVGHRGGADAQQHLVLRQGGGCGQGGGGHGEGREQAAAQGQ
jgi:hypothetical protein